MAQSSSNDVCNLPKQIGPCKGLVLSFYFNKDTQQCDEFNYGGCLGNDNRFPSRKLCEKRCLAVKRETNMKVESASLELPSQCLLDKDSGPCKALLSRYFFNKLTKKCENFIFGSLKF